MSQLKKILLVDDDEDLREALSEQLLMTEDFDVFEAGNGQEAMERAREARQALEQGSSFAEVARAKYELDVLVLDVTSRDIRKGEGRDWFIDQATAFFADRRQSSLF